jgi:hypothetical protein
MLSSGKNGGIAHLILKTRSDMVDKYLKLYDECNKMRAELDQEVKNVTGDKELEVFLDKVERLKSKYNKLRELEDVWT